MLLPSLFTSDLHLTDRPLDEYRWSLFPQLVEIANRHGCMELFILGDLTEEKDRHSSRLVNRLVEALHWLRKESRINMIHILRGNHDGVDPGRPFFRFLETFPWCRFYVAPCIEGVGGAEIGFLPHSRSPETDWPAVELGRCDLVLLHGTLDGSIAETGSRLRGIDPELFAGVRVPILAGDIHVPQAIGPVEYVGAPYPIRFGDQFEGRAVVWTGSDWIAEPIKAPRKAVIDWGLSERLDLSGLDHGDQLKIRIHLRQSELGEWHDRKRRAQDIAFKAGVVLCGLELVRIPNRPMLKKHAENKKETAEDFIRGYCVRNKVSTAQTALGLDIIKEAVK